MYLCRRLITAVALGVMVCSVAVPVHLPRCRIGACSCCRVMDWVAENGLGFALRPTGRWLQAFKGSSCLQFCSADKLLSPDLRLGPFARFPPLHPAVQPTTHTGTRRVGDAAWRRKRDHAHQLLSNRVNKLLK